MRTSRRRRAAAAPAAARPAAVPTGATHRRRADARPLRQRCTDVAGARCYAAAPMSPGSNVAAITRLIKAPPKRVPADELMPLVYQELRRLARARLARLKPGQTVSATELVHEVWLKVAAGSDPGWEGKAHFFGAAANAMREILVDQARRRTAKKRDVARKEVLPSDVPEFRDGLPSEDLLSLHEALAG